MVGVMLALLLGGAPGAPKVEETWTPAGVLLAPALVVEADSLDLPLKEIAPEPAAKPDPGEPAPAPTGFQTVHLEKAVVRPAL